MMRGDFTPTVPGPGSHRPKVERRLAAIFGADIVGYSALMELNEEDTHRRVGATLDRVIHEIEKSHGRVFGFAGDGVMAEFPSAVEALKCGLRIQVEAGKRNIGLPARQGILFRIGINSGEIILRNGRTGGNAVNIAARLEQIAEPGGICLSSSVFDQVKRIVAAGYEFIGEQHLKNIKDPVTAYSIGAAACGAWVGMPVLPRQTRLATANAVPSRFDSEYRASLAVLPFRTLQNDQEDAYFAEGMVDDIITALGALEDLLVIARSSTQSFAGAPLDVRTVGYELDVRYVLHGSVRRFGATLRTAVELSEAHSGRVIWADRFDGALTDLFELQDRIASHVATAIAPHLRDRELSRARRKHPQSMTAYDLTLQALDLLHRMDRASLARGRELLERATKHDSDYAPAYSHMAFLLLRWIAHGWSNDEATDIATAACAARRAIERDRNDALALAIYGHIQSYLLKDYATAKGYLERAIIVGPSCPSAWGFSSVTSGYLGDYKTAVERAEKAVRLSPLGPDAYWFEHFLSQAYYLSGRFEESIAWGRMSDVHHSAIPANQRVLIASFVALGRMDEARQVAQRLLHVSPTFRLTEFRSRTPLNAESRELFLERLRLAGLPD